MDCSLYIHIPFCVQKCDYCDFFSLPESNRRGTAPDEDYVDSVLNEIKFYVKKLNISSWRTVYVGGGTPSILPEVLLEKLVTKAVSSVPNRGVREITVEVNPQDVTESLVRTLGECGVSRISMGIQALDDVPLQKISRRCTKNQIENALDILKENWRRALSVDFIAGLPGQTHASFEAQFEKIASYPVQHISLYTLTVEEGTALFKKIESGAIRFSPEKADKMWIKGRSILEKKGFFQYEVSNFAKKGFESAHNCGYWNLENYVGAGCGATSSIYGAAGKRWTNTKCVRKYEKFWLENEKSGEEPDFLVEKEPLSLETQEFEYLMMGFRKLSGVSSEDFAQRFNKSLEERIGVSGGIFSEWKKNGLAKVRKTDRGVFYALNSRGIMRLNLFLESLL